MSVNAYPCLPLQFFPVNSNIVEYSPVVSLGETRRDNPALNNVRSGWNHGPLKRTSPQNNPKRDTDEGMENPLSRDEKTKHTQAKDYHRNIQKNEGHTGTRTSEHDT
ncbi:MAG: hypothetical protein RRA35_10625 [Desulfomonilia bacterium]|nr:hypothetical protein [Desulfomonilia bacterium]